MRLEQGKLSQSNSPARTLHIGILPVTRYFEQRLYTKESSEREDGSHILSQDSIIGSPWAIIL